jgi:cyclohexanone monooxygenase
VVSSGSLNRPKLPGIPGLKSFKGHTFHTSRWDYDYTGGTPLGGLDKLRDKRKRKMQKEARKKNKKK